jgi:nitrogen fixation NifU-like protein
MAVFCGVREFPARVKCASLAWHTMIQALENSNKVAITETILN